MLIVHGNHNMKEFSDPGYGYLGELLASRGFILVSVDENFLNGNIRGENDARGWMLLQHLRDLEAIQRFGRRSVPRAGGYGQHRADGPFAGRRGGGGRGGVQPALPLSR